MNRSSLLSHLATACWGFGGFMLFLGSYYWIVENQEFKRNNSSVFGEIQTFQQEVYLRPSKALMWQGVLQPQQVYQSDVVKTGEHSSVHIKTNAGGSIKISENSLVVLENSPKGPEISLRNGNLSISGKASLIARGEKVNIEGTLNARTDANSGQVELVAESGQLTFESSQTDRSLVSEGNSLLIDKSGKTTVKSYSFRRLLPKASSSIILSKENNHVEFQIEQIDKSADLKPLVLQISSTEDFKNVEVHSLKRNLNQKISLAKRKGKVFWRVYNKKSKAAASAIGEFTLTNPLLWTWKTPEESRYARIDNSGLTTVLSWGELENTDSYQLVLKDQEKVLLQIDKLKTSTFSMKNVKNELYREIVLNNRELLEKELKIELHAFQSEQKIASLSSTFTINDMRPPEQPTLKEARFMKEDPSKILIAWNEVERASGYEIQSDHKALSIRENKSSLPIRDLESGTVKVRSLRGHLKGPWLEVKIPQSKLKRQIAFIEPIKLIYPVDDSRFLSEQSTNLKAEWTLDGRSRKLVDYFVVELLKDKKVIMTKNVKDTHLQLTALAPGKYTWRVKSYFKDLGEGQSATQVFKVIKGVGLSAPQWKE
ncbi:hypothetical protein GW915_01290 [bacterium]|nr:hypothetical protein [bacterium]